jgi:hypothetical protein
MSDHIVKDETKDKAPAEIYEMNCSSMPLRELLMGCGFISNSIETC